MDLIHTSLTCFHLTNFFVEKNLAGCLLKTKQKKVLKHCDLTRKFVCSLWKCKFSYHINQSVLRRQPDIFFSSTKSQSQIKYNIHSTNPINTSYLTDSYTSFTLNLESGQNVCSDRSIRSSTYRKKNISDFPPCGKLVIFVNEFVIFLKTSK